MFVNHSLMFFTVVVTFVGSGLHPAAKVIRSGFAVITKIEVMVKSGVNVTQLISKRIVHN